jgi:hypothetical protein
MPATRDTMPTSIAGSHFPKVATGRATPVEMRSHVRNVTHMTNLSQAQKFNGLLKFHALAATYRMC